MTGGCEPDAEIERFVVFDCEGDACVGVLSAPASARRDGIGVVIIVGGPQYRVGSHRHFVLLARALAAHGVPTLRFDYRGMGDSEGEPRTFEAIDADIAAAIGALQRECGVSRVVLWGLCDGATAALMYAAADERVAGIVALNPWARSAQTEASTRLKHYYLRRLCSPGFWRKVLRGEFDLRGGAGGVLQSVHSATSARTETPDFLARMENGWMRLRRPVLLLLSGQDYTAREFETWVAGTTDRRALVRRQGTRVCAFADADHTFSSRAWRDAVTSKTIGWMDSLE